MASCLLLLGGCVKDDSSLCPQLVDFTIGCYEEVVGRSPTQQEINDWSNSCEINHHSDSCLNCAMEASCDDYLQRSDYVYNTLCAGRCP